MAPSLAPAGRRGGSACDGQPLQRDLQSHLDGAVVFGDGVRGALELPDVDARERLHGLHHRLQLFGDVDRPP